MGSEDRPPASGAAISWDALDASCEKKAVDWVAELDRRRAACERASKRTRLKKALYWLVSGILAVGVAFVTESISGLFFALLPAALLSLLLFEQPKIELRRFSLPREITAALAKSLFSGTPLSWKLDPVITDEEDQRWLAGGVRLGGGRELKLELALHVEEHTRRYTVQNSDGEQEERVETTYLPQEILSVRVDLPEPEAWAGRSAEEREAATRELREALCEGAPVWPEHVQIEGSEGAPELQLRFATERGRLSGEEFHGELDDEALDTGFMAPERAVDCVRLAVDAAGAACAPAPAEELARSFVTQPGAGLGPADPGEAQAGPPSEARPLDAWLEELEKRRAASSPRAGPRLPRFFVFILIAQLALMLWIFEFNPWMLLPFALIFGFLAFFFRRRRIGDPRRFVLTKTLLSGLSGALRAGEEVQLGLAQQVNMKGSARWLALKAPLSRGARLALEVELELKPAARQHRARERLRIQLVLPEPPQEEALAQARAALKARGDLRLIEFSAEDRTVTARLLMPWARVTEVALMDSMSGTEAAEGSQVTEGMLRPAAAARCLKSVLELSRGEEAW